jgi:hypothetical protein
MSEQHPSRRDRVLALTRRGVSLSQAFGIIDSQDLRARQDERQVAMSAARISNEEVVRDAFARGQYDVSLKQPTSAPLTMEQGLTRLGLKQGLDLASAQNFARRTLNRARRGGGTSGPAGASL